MLEWWLRFSFYLLIDELILNCILFESLCMNGKIGS